MKNEGMGCEDGRSKCVCSVYTHNITFSHPSHHPKPKNYNISNKKHSVGSGQTRASERGNTLGKRARALARRFAIYFPNLMFWHKRF